MVKDNLLLTVAALQNVFMKKESIVLLPRQVVFMLNY